MKNLTFSHVTYVQLQVDNMHFKKDRKWQRDLIEFSYQITGGIYK